MDLVRACCCPCQVSLAGVDLLLAVAVLFTALCVQYSPAPCSIASWLHSYVVACTLQGAGFMPDGTSRFSCRGEVSGQANRSRGRHLPPCRLDWSR